MLQRRLGALVVLWAAALAAPVAADTGDRPSALPKLINLDTPYVTAPHRWDVAADVRLFAKAEKGTYGSLSVSYGVTQDWAVTVRGTAGVRVGQTFGGVGIVHGGEELELMARYGSSAHSRWAAAVGLSIPDTPSQKNPHFTLAGMYRQPLSDRADLYVVPQTVPLNKDALVGIGGGVDFRPVNRLHLIGDVTGVVAGQNTRRPSTGARTRDEVWGLGLRYEPLDDLSVDLAWTNGCGTSTGFSLTPGLGGATALLVGLSFSQ
ncbi:MAG: hypothetical protein HYU66_15350 [Armatimonadetes bacterium]|nr:hypothetical protein [Armatimonadota bacterium]